MGNLQARAAAIAARIGWSGLLAILLVASLVNQYADISFKGPLGLGIHFEGWKPKAQRLQGVIDDIDHAEGAALIRAEAAKEATEKDYRQLAGRIDDNANEAREGAMADAERFIAAGGVRCPADRSAAGGTAPPARDHSAGYAQGAGRTAELDAAGSAADPALVAVTPDDVRVCTANTLKAETAQAWAIAIEAASRVPPDDE